MIYSTIPTHWRWITVSGPDAADYLHRMTTVNVQALEPGQGSPGCFLNPQGKIRAYFNLWRTTGEGFAFELDGGQNGRWATELVTAIDQFHFTEKFAIQETHKELGCVWLFRDEEEGGAESGSELGYARDASGCHVCRHGSRDFGRDWISAWGTESQLKEWRDRNASGSHPLSPELLEEWRIRSLRPKADLELTPESNPLEIGLFDSISSNKGCYPGQEVIEKIISLGAPPRRLARIEGQGAAPAPGTALSNLASPPAEVGTLTSVVPKGPAFEALAILRKIHAKEGMEVTTSSGSSGKVIEIAPYA